MRIVRRIALVVAGLVVLGWVLGSVYYLPSHEKVHITGTEVKREDFTRPDGTKDSRDVRYIMAETLKGKVKAFRNEDTGWGFPFYFKFDSGDLSAQASAIARNQPDAVVLVSYYGMRAHLASLYPNALSLDVVDSEYEPFPLFVFLYIATCFALGVLGYLGVRRLMQWRPFKKKEPSSSEKPSSSEEPPPDKAIA